MIDYISAFKSQMTFMALDFEVEKVRMKADLKIMMAELWLKPNWSKFKTIPRDIFTPVNRDETSHENGN